MRLADKLRKADSDKVPFDPEKVSEIVEVWFTSHPQGSFTVYFDGYEVKSSKSIDYNYVMPKHWFNQYREYMSEQGFIMVPSYGRSGFEMTWRLY